MLWERSPKTVKKELPVIAQKRKEFNNELAYLRGKIAEADILLTKLDEIENLILNIRSQALLGNLLIRQAPLIYPSTLFIDTKLFVQFGYDIIKSPVTWYQNLDKDGREYVRANLVPFG